LIFIVLGYINFNVSFIFKEIYKKDKFIYFSRILSIVTYSSTTMVEGDASSEYAEHILHTSQPMVVRDILYNIKSQVL